ncbi:hypothetical protein [Flavobacterium crassostreae]|uniref:TonB-dependent receptor n=1 Tax=Flavobacterium crassostreae TaxID=1763534 RepID=A0A1B9E4P0_9FLAO|nr:hypothetical protein [Flavobacterium crassostreae]OCB76838.1 hypothetical protein LPBF_05340 [Flavobacterium crassostreae]
MLKKGILFVALLFFSGLHAQKELSLYTSKKIAPSKDSIVLETVGINPAFFKIEDAKGAIIDSSFYGMNFWNGKLLLKTTSFSRTDSLQVHYLKFPDFITQEYRIYNENQIVSKDIGSEKRYTIEETTAPKNLPFDGLNTSGSITRGLTVGNNQNGVLNSNLELQITGNLSEKVRLTASLQDSNIPLQDGGYSQKLDQFDNIFLELASDRWKIRGGDLFLENHQTQFLNFNKKVQGLAAHFDFGSDAQKNSIFTSVALVKGQYAKSTFTANEGNQGPYKLKGQNGELYVLVISGSERVYVNGLLLQRGENKDYTMDYNAGEIIFTPLYPITSEMRMVVEYQYSDQSYSRFVHYSGAIQETKKWRFGGYLYSETDLKNQPLQQNLSQEQLLVLQNAGDDPRLMNAPSAYIDSYSDNKTLYIQKSNGTATYFEYSKDPNAQLYHVRFTSVGVQKGNYRLMNTNSINKTYQYIAPLNGIPQGEYEPITQLVAPNKLQIATFLGNYNPSEKTNIALEIALSNQDQNLFSTLEDANNKGISTKINTKQRLFSKKGNLDAFANFQFTKKEFRTVERLYNIEFNRDWNLGTTGNSDQSLLVTGLHYTLAPTTNAAQNGSIKYQFEKLDFSGAFSGNRHLFGANYKINNWRISNQSSYLNSQSTAYNSHFTRSRSTLQYNFNQNWVGGRQQSENNQETDQRTTQLSAISQRFSEYGLFMGRGDTTKVFVAVAYLHRANDSVQNGALQRVSNSHTYSLKSKIIQTNTSDLTLLANYRTFNFIDPSKKKEASLNSRIVYSDQFYNQFIQSTTAYETNSGTMPQQEFTYLEVADGQGFYTWKDYNTNGIQELQEFEVAPFVDQAKYIRVYLPRQVFIKTHQTKFSQALTLNPNIWQNATGYKKFLSLFYNQTSFIMDRKTKNSGTNFNLNPFNGSPNNVLGLSLSFRNRLFYNRGKQHNSITYSYLNNQAKNLLTIGSQESKNSSHQLQYTHLYQKSWLVNAMVQSLKTSGVSENFSDKNYLLSGYQIAPKISYLFSKSTSWDVFYELQNKQNQIGAFETLLQNRFGTSFSYSGTQKIVANGSVSLYQNKFSGNEFSAVGFQMLEGLQNGKNITWQVLLQKKVTSYLDVNLNYQGRKSRNNPAIHTGNMQLRAYF